MNMKNLFKNVLLASHPVGSIFITTDGDFDPHEKWGGSWELLKDKFLVGAGDAYTLGASGGEAEHTLTMSEMPAHSHGAQYQTSSGTLSFGYVYQNKGQMSGTGESSSGLSTQGNSQPHNNLPPYTAVNMWLRTA